MAMLKYMHDGDADSAIHYLKRMRQTDMVQRYLHECYRIKGDYTTLAAAQDSFYRAQMADIDKWNIYNFGDINARIINMGINMQNQKLLAIRQDEDAKRKETALHNANLKLANAQPLFVSSASRKQRHRRWGRGQVLSALSTNSYQGSPGPKALRELRLFERFFDIDRSLTAPLLFVPGSLSAYPFR